MLFRQLFDRKSCTYSYLLADEQTREAVLIDPVLECNERDLKLVEELDLNVRYVLETHIHADHVTGVKAIIEKTGALFALSKESRHTQAHILLNDGDVLCFGSRQLKALITRGHTKSCMSFMCDNMLFTGDLLLIRGCGRVDFQGGDARELYESVHNKIYIHPDETLIYPGHDYNGRDVSTVGEEKRFNPRLKEKNSFLDFSRIMNELKLTPPSLMNESISKNLNCLS